MDACIRACQFTNLKIWWWQALALHSGEVVELDTWLVVQVMTAVLKAGEADVAVDVLYLSRDILPLTENSLWVTLMSVFQDVAEQMDDVATRHAFCDTVLQCLVAQIRDGRLEIDD